MELKIPKLVAILLPVLSTGLSLLLCWSLTLDKGYAEIVLWFSLGGIPVGMLVALICLVVAIADNKVRRLGLSISASLFFFIVPFVYLVFFERIIAR